jgi:hypothetical protein
MVNIIQRTLFAGVLVLASCPADSQCAAGDALELKPPFECVDQAVADRVYLLLQGQARYLISKVHTWDKDTNLKLLTDSRSGEHWIRPNAGAIAGFAFLYRFGRYDPRVVGISRDTLRSEYILPMIRYLTTTHVTGTRPTGDGKPWGRAWQSAHWTTTLARGAWWIWNDLPEDVQRDLRRVVRDEAERIANASPVYGIENDTKAEENAWNSTVLSAAILLMPNDPQRPLWEKQFQRWAMSSFLRPADARCETIIDGRKVSEQFEGANIYDDFTLENHHNVHPDYMSCFTITMACEADYLMSSRKPPQSLRYNAAGIYENLKWFALPDGGLVYPSGQDWRLFRIPMAFVTHIVMATLGRDPDAWSLAMQGLNTIELMQKRSPSGQIFLDEEYFFASTQTDLAAHLARTWLLLHCTDRIVDNPRPKTGVLRLDNGKIILNRTKKTVHTCSWGRIVMAQMFNLGTPEPDRLVSPDQRNGIGEIILTGQDRPEPLSLRSVTVTDTADTFNVQLELDHGSAVRASLAFTSANDAFTISERLIALRDVRTKQIATGQIGILNNRHWVHESGIRRLNANLNDPDEIFEACSGKVFEAATGHIDLDCVFDIKFAKGGHVFEEQRWRYVAADAPVRGRATDKLFLNWIGEERTWKKGDVISDWQAEINWSIHVH